jgi:hypothetical protein
VILLESREDGLHDWAGSDTFIILLGFDLRVSLLYHLSHLAKPVIPLIEIECQAEGLWVFKKIYMNSFTAIIILNLLLFHHPHTFTILFFASSILYP